MNRREALKALTTTALSTFVVGSAVAAAARRSPWMRPVTGRIPDPFEGLTPAARQWSRLSAVLDRHLWELQCTTEAIRQVVADYGEGPLAPRWLRVETEPGAPINFIAVQRAWPSDGCSMHKILLLKRTPVDLLCLYEVALVDKIIREAQAEAGVDVSLVFTTEEP